MKPYWLGEPDYLVRHPKARRKFRPLPQTERTKQMSYKPEVIADDSGQWVGNSTRFATREEAEKSARDLHARWMLVTKWRVVESEDPVNYKWDNGNVPLTTAEVSTK